MRSLSFILYQIKTPHKLTPTQILYIMSDNQQQGSGGDMLDKGVAYGEKKEGIDVVRYLFLNIQ